MPETAAAIGTYFSAAEGTAAVGTAAAGAETAGGLAAADAATGYTAAAAADSAAGAAAAETAAGGLGQGTLGAGTFDAATSAAASESVAGSGIQAATAVGNAGAGMNPLYVAGAKAIGSAALSAGMNSAFAPKRPDLPRQLPMPDPVAQEEARKRSIVEQLSRRGRASTVLTDAGTLGG